MRRPTYLALAIASFFVSGLCLYLSMQPSPIPVTTGWSGQAIFPGGIILGIIFLIRSQGKFLSSNIKEGTIIDRRRETGSTVPNGPRIWMGGNRADSSPTTFTPRGFYHQPTTSGPDHFYLKLSHNNQTGWVRVDEGTYNRLANGDYFR